MVCCVPFFGQDASSTGAEGQLVEPRPADDPTEGMVQLGGGFLMGTDYSERFLADGEDPVREVTVRPFYVDSTAVSNAQFLQFVYDTAYVTEAERFGWSFVFHLFVSRRVEKAVKQAVAETPWWWKVEGAFWKHPEGPGSNVKKRMDHPVVHVSWNDADAYSRWAGKRLPTEAEWELAARGGLEQKLYPWGDELTPESEHRCNIWQGRFPDMNTKADGFIGNAPARSFEPNGFGLYNTSGNVWEWCSDWFSRDFYANGDRENPSGPPSGTDKIAKGGSYLCHESYCNRYRVAARTASSPDSSTGHMGFRCAIDAG